MAENKDMRDELDALDSLKELESLGGGATEHTEAPKQVSEPERRTKKAKKKEKIKGKWWIVRFLDGDIFKSKFVQKQWGVLLLALVFGIIMVSNRYKVERLQKDKIATEQRISYLEEKRVQMQSQSQEMMKISTIISELEEQGIGIIDGPPYEI